MGQNNPNTNVCSTWSPEEIEELRRSLQSSDVAEVDAFAFGKRFSQILSPGRNTSNHAPLELTRHFADRALLGSEV
jgi:hypothetical protein